MRIRNGTPAHRYKTTAHIGKVSSAHPEWYPAHIHTRRLRIRLGVGAHPEWYSRASVQDDCAFGKVRVRIRNGTPVHWYKTTGIGLGAVRIRNGTPAHLVNTMANFRTDQVRIRNGTYGY